MYLSPYNSERPYTGQSLLLDNRCRICGTTDACFDTATVPMPYPPFDLDDAAHGEPGGPLLLYTVTTDRGYTTVMQLNESDAARYGPAAVLQEAP